MSYGQSGRTEAVAVTAVGKDVEFGRDVGGFELQEPSGGVFNVDGIVFGLQEKGWRGLVAGMEVRVVAEAYAWLLIGLRHDG